MKTKQITLLVAICSLLLVFVGVGYAYTAYSSNNGNSADVVFITLTQTDEENSSKYTFTDEDYKIEIDTYNDKDATYYTLGGNVLVGNYSCANLGFIYLNLDYNGSATAPETINIDVAGSTNFKGSPDWVYFLGNAPNNGVVSEIYAYKTNDEDTAWTDGPNALTSAIDNDGNYPAKPVYLYYGCLKTESSVSFDGKSFYKNTEQPKQLVNGSIVFKASTTDATTGNPLLTVTYNNNIQNSESTCPLTVVSGSRVLSFDETGFTAPEGQHFVGWNTQKNATEALQITSITENTILYAIYATN